MLCAVWIQLHVSLVFGAALRSVSGSSEVREYSSFYSCCGSPTIPLEQDCEHTCSIHDMPIAHFSSISNDCIFPCKNIDGGTMTLHTCTDVNTTVTCTNEMNVIDERSIQYKGQHCSENKSNELAPGKHGPGGLVLLTAIVTGWFGNR
ncbi:hypothetical protein EXN66_Car008110 [Channa argus]|uniref:Uncharacterized protein n=1 Tax=Channa argus TaxID=215402 RepID=A0A6G1PQK7_CHAAH|nr:hypothetical protein EXN66_Car008110 [Channa argus]KAK2909668.1 hypothetical protein Q8A73_007383 [Channa argus]